MTPVADKFGWRAHAHAHHSFLCFLIFTFSQRWPPTRGNWPSTLSWRWYLGIATTDLPPIQVSISGSLMTDSGQLDSRPAWVFQFRATGRPAQTNHHDFLA